MSKKLTIGVIDLYFDLVGVFVDSARRSCVCSF